MATARTGFAIRVDSVSSAAMRFAATMHAPFMAADETVLKPGQVISVVAPSPSDTMLAGALAL